MLSTIGTVNHAPVNPIIYDIITITIEININPLIKDIIVDTFDLSIDCIKPIDTIFTPITIKDKKYILIPLQVISRIPSILLENILAINSGLDTPIIKNITPETNEIFLANLKADMTLSIFFAP